MEAIKTISLTLLGMIIGYLLAFFLISIYESIDKEEKESDSLEDAVFVITADSIYKELEENRPSHVEMFVPEGDTMVITICNNVAIFPIPECDDYTLTKENGKVRILNKISYAKIENMPIIDLKY